MPYSRASALAVVASFMVLAAGPSAHAVPLIDSNWISVTAGGVSATFTIHNCTLDGIACIGSAELVQNGSQLGVKIQSATGTSSLLTTNHELTFDLSISTSQPVYGLTLGMAGSGPFASVGETLTGVLPVSAIFVDTVGTQAFTTFAPTTLFTSSKDLATHNPLLEDEEIIWVTQDLLVPEPASVALLGLGVLGAAAFRRKRFLLPGDLFFL